MGSSAPDGDAECRAEPVLITHADRTTSGGRPFDRALTALSRVHSLLLAAPSPPRGPGTVTRRRGRRGRGRGGARAEHADPVAHGSVGPPPLGPNGAVAGGEHQPVTTRDSRRRGPRLRQRALLDHDELAAGVVHVRLVEADDDLQGEDEVAVEVAVECVEELERADRDLYGDLIVPCRSSSPARRGLHRRRVDRGASNAHGRGARPRRQYPRSPAGVHHHDRPVRTKRGVGQRPCATASASSLQTATPCA